MTKEMILPIVRHTLSVVLGGFVAKGAMNGNDAEALTAGLLVVVNLIWMFIEKRNKKNES